MTVKTKSRILSALSSGLFFAVAMAGFDYVDGLNFRIWRFVINFLFFGTFMVFVFPKKN